MRIFAILCVVLLIAGCSEETSSSSSTTPVKYKNCDDVRAHHADPIREGDPGFQSKFDRDGDGVGCEKY